MSKCIPIKNGKNGRCRYSGYCYEPTDKKRTARKKKLMKLRMKIITK